MAGWGDVDKKEGSKGAGRFVQFEEGIPVRMRILDEEPYTTRTHKISQPVKKGDKVEEVFRSIPATDNPDDNYILKMNGTRYPDVMQFNMRVAQFKKGADGKDTDDAELRILQGGPAIFKPLKLLFTEHGSLSKFDVTITRKGTSRETEYTVTAAPFSKNIDVDAQRAALQADAALSDWKNVFPSVSGEDQQKAIMEAGFNITYDPAATISATMSLEKAQSLTMTFGKFKGKTIGELMVIDAGYVSWAAGAVTSNDELAAACRVAVRAMEGGVVESSKPAALPAPKTAVPAQAPAAAPAAADPKERANLKEAISEVFDQNPRFEDIEVVVEAVKKHSGGKTKLNDLTVDQLKSLYADIV